MTLAIHQNTSAGAGYRKSLEGWSRAGIKYVELTNTLLDEFLKTDYPASRPPGAHRPGTDSRSRRDWRGGSLGAESQSRRLARESQETLRDVRDPGTLNRVYASTATTQKVTLDDYKTGADNMREAGEVAKQFNMSLRIEFVRTSYIHLHVDDAAQDDARGGASEPRAHVRLLSLLVRPQQARGSRSDPARGNWSRALSGCARYAAGVIG